jgi:hypothetical protein
MIVIPLYIHHVQPNLLLSQKIKNKNLQKFISFQGQGKTQVEVHLVLMSLLDFLLFSSLSFHKRKTCSLQRSNLEKIEKKYRREICKEDRKKIERRREKKIMKR